MYISAPEITDKRVINASAHSDIRVSSTSPISLYLGFQADGWDRIASIFDTASMIKHVKERV